MDTTFGKDNPRINVISGNVGGGPVRVQTFDRAGAAMVTSAPCAPRGWAAPRARGPDRTDIAGALAAFLANLGPEPWQPRPRPAGLPLSRPLVGPSPGPRAATFRPGSELQVATPPPARPGRMIELD